ncbi:hypothetical protein PINS_up018353 [Pythium insidiosum]|nr:hypothetical protein PINS_up018353 [Pythium insidiosum]
MEHILFHMWRSVSQHSVYTSFASLRIQTMMYTRFQMTRVQEIRSLLMTPNADMQAWRGRVIEDHLLEGITTSKFEVRPLEDRGGSIAGDFCPLNAEPVVLQATSDVEAALRLYLPLSKVFPSIDAILVIPQSKIIAYIQVTVASKHPVKYTHLENVYNEIKKRPDLKDFEHIVLFLVTNDIYVSFKCQAYKNADGKKRRRPITIDVSQYVARVLFDDQQDPFATPFSPTAAEELKCSGTFF